MHLNHALKLHFLRFLNINTPSKRSVPFCEELVTPFGFTAAQYCAGWEQWLKFLRGQGGGDHFPPRLVACLGEKIGGDEKLYQFVISSFRVSLMSFGNFLGSLRTKPGFHGALWVGPGFFPGGFWRLVGIFRIHMFFFDVVVVVVVDVDQWMFVYDDIVVAIEIYFRLILTWPLVIVETFVISKS